MQKIIYPKPKVVAFIKKGFFGLLLLMVLPIASLASSKHILDPKLFPRSEVIDVQVYFWKQIFTTVSSEEVVFHDKELVLPIYKKLSLEGLSRKQAKKKVDQQKRVIQNQLKTLAYALEKKKKLTKSQSTLLKKFYSGITPKGLKRAAQRIRVQNGVADRFRDGIVRSGAYMSYIHQVFKEYGLPLELAHLPHVESSFHYGSHSKSGAKGIWQFTKTTGKQYMRVNSRLDERIDPFISTVAAAKLLKSNYELLGAWPLAITGYNHGPNGVKRISDRLRSKDLGYLIRHYRSSRFGFASKNFYAEFLAAVEVASDYERYFGPLELDPPLRFKEVRLKKNMPIHRIASNLNYSTEQLLALNPAFTPPVVRGIRYVPSYYRVKVPIGEINESQLAHNQNFLKKLNLVGFAENSRSSKLKRIIVESGDSLSEIASRYKMTTKRLATINGISLKTPIYPGQVLHVTTAEKPQSVTVKRGDSLIKIAQRFNMSLQELMSLNRISSKTPIHPGQILHIKPLVANTYVVKKGDNLTAIARRANISFQQLIQANDLNQESTIFPGQRLILPTEKQAPYKITVKRGDTLGSIARRNGIRMEQLIDANGLSPNSIIYPGQRLIIDF